jgi:hypothetical protein
VSDKQYRTALRRWQASNSREDWQALLRVCLRTGQPLFTPEALQEALEAETLTHFEITDDGFIARVEGAKHPRIHVEMRISPAGWEYEGEYFPLWDTWDGSVIVTWDEYFDPACPALHIIVDGFSINEDSDAVESIHHGNEHYIYEGNEQQDACITNMSQLTRAVREGITDWTT